MPLALYGDEARYTDQAGFTEKVLATCSCDPLLLGNGLPDAVGRLQVFELGLEHLVSRIRPATGYLGSKLPPNLQP